jgi:hypothetical protein
MSISTVWFLLDAFLGLDPATRVISSSFLVYTAPVRLVLAGLSAIAIFYVLEFIIRQSRLKAALKISVNHHVRNELQVMTLALDLYEADPSPESHEELRKATNDISELVKRLDDILDEKKEFLVKA